MTRATSASSPPGAFGTTSSAPCTWRASFWLGHGHARVEHDRDVHPLHGGLDQVDDVLARHGAAHARAPAPARRSSPPPGRTAPRCRRPPRAPGPPPSRTPPPPRGAWPRRRRRSARSSAGASAAAPSPRTPTWACRRPLEPAEGIVVVGSGPRRCGPRGCALSSARISSCVRRSARTSSIRASMDSAVASAGAFTGIAGGGTRVLPRPSRASAARPPPRLRARAACPARDLGQRRARRQRRVRVVEHRGRGRARPRAARHHHRLGADARPRGHGCRRGARVLAPEPGAARRAHE